MPKRFTATEKWTDPWFTSLPERDRLFWIYLLDNCDNAGIWRRNEMLITAYFPGYVFDPLVWASRLTKINDEKWFIPKFIEFQYGTLNPDSRPHASVLSRLKKEGVSIGYSKSIHTIKDKDKEQDKDKEGVREGVGGIEAAAPLGAFEKIWERYPRKLGKEESRVRFKREVITMVDFLDIQKALDNFLAQIHEDKTETQYTPHGSTWFNKRWRDYINWQIVPRVDKLAPAGHVPIPAGKYSNIDEVKK